MRRSLTLKRETLAELSALDLTSVVAGAVGNRETLDVLACLSLDHTCIKTTR